MHRIIHLIPYDGIGGVERAAATMRDVSSGDIDFCVETIFTSAAAHHRWVEWNPWYYLRTTIRLLFARTDVLIVSLWRAYALGIVLKLLGSRIRLVVFLHSPHDVHSPDRLLTRVAVRLAFRVWADSRETLAKRLSDLPLEKGRVISFVTARIASLPPKLVQPIFIFWGRLHVQKGIPRALRIFAGVKAQQPDAMFLVIGPDGGDLGRVREVADSLGLAGSLRYLGGMNFTDIQTVARQASFYLQTSELEGMAMSVVEAMQLGLLPVVTPVGEIAHYCRHNENAIMVTEDSRAVDDILSLLNDDARYQFMRQQAVATWRAQPLYKDSVMAACRELISNAL